MKFKNETNYTTVMGFRRVIKEDLELREQKNIFWVLIQVVFACCTHT